MRAQTSAERARARHGLALLISVPCGLLLASQVAAPGGLIAAAVTLGATVAGAVFASTVSEVGARRALVRALLTGVAALGVIAVATFGACVSTQCVR
jgi:hypothetical protein